MFLRSGGEHQAELKIKSVDVNCSVDEGDENVV